jgi:hypothetical protein
MNRRNILCALTMCLVSMSAMAVGIPPHGGFNLFDQLLNESFSGDGYTASVTSTVYDLGPTAGGYLYTYQITGATTKFTWFSVAFYKGTSIMNYSVEAPGTAPNLWEPVEDAANPSSIEAAFFNPGLTSGSSALLWFTSPTSPVHGVGALAKLSATDGGYAEGVVLVPTPEPMTMTLLGLGMLALRSIKRK